MMKSSPAIIVSVPRSSTAAELPRIGKKSSNRLDSEEEKQEVTEIANSDNTDASMGRDWRARRPRQSDSEEVEEEEEETEETLPGAFSSEQGNLVRRVKGRITTSTVEEGQTLSLTLMENEGPTSPSAVDEQSTIMGELAEPSQEDEELRRRYQELQQVVNEAVTGTVIVENSGAGDHDQNTAPAPFGRKERRFWLCAALASLLVVGVILGVVIPLTTKNDKGSPSIDSVVTPTQSPAPTKAPTAAPTTCT